MKKKTLFGIVLVLSIIAIYNIYKSQDCKKISNLMLSDLESLADSSEGCISKTDKNNGDCTTDGSVYFCENSYWIHDCVKGEYPN